MKVIRYDTPSVPVCIVVTLVPFLVVFGMWYTKYILGLVLGIIIMLCATVLVLSATEGRCKRTLGIAMCIGIVLGAFAAVLVDTLIQVGLMSL